MAYVSDFMSHDQRVLGVYSGLDVVPAHSGTPSAGGHGASIWIGEGNLLIGGFLQLFLDTAQLAHVLLHRGEAEVPIIAEGNRTGEPVRELTREMHKLPCASPNRVEFPLFGWLAGYLLV